MHQIRNLTLLAVVCGLLLSTMVGAASLAAAEESVSSQPASARAAARIGDTTPTSGKASTAESLSTPWSGGLSVPAWILWPLGLIELWLVVWLSVWSVALIGARRFLFDVDASMRNISFGRIPFSGGVPLTLAHLTFARAFAAHPWVADQWVDGHSSTIGDWLSIDARGFEPGDRDILVRIDGQAIAIADSPTVRAILPESPFVLALHGEGRKWNEQVLNIVLRQCMHAEPGHRLLSHRTIPVLLDRNCVERLRAGGKSVDTLPHWLQVVRNELCRIPGVAASLDDDLLKCLVQTRRILPIADQWSQTPAGFQVALQAAVSAGDLPCLVVFDDEDAIAEMKCLVRARSMNSPASLPRVLTTSAAVESRSTELTRVQSTADRPRSFDRSAVPLLVRSLDDSVAEVRLAAAQTLGGLGAAAVDSVAQLTTLLHDPVTACRQAAVNALGAIGPVANEATQALTEAAGKDHRKVRAAACRALGAIGQPDDEVLATLTAALSDNDVAVRSQAARSLGGFGIGRPGVVSALKVALNDESADVRAHAVAAISAIPEAINDSVPDLVAAIADPVAEVRRKVVAALGNTQRFRDAIVQTLAHSLADPDADTRSSAAVSLSRFGLESRAAIPQLARLVGDSVTAVRHSAVEALGAIGVPSLESVSALEEATRDVDESVRSAATAALERAMPVAAVA
jgi:HEAT repeat protein